MEIVWPMSETESWSRARELALDAMRTKASNAVGKIVESSETLRDDKLSEEIRTIGVSMVKLEDVRDTVKVDSSGRLILSVTANATIDDSELGRRAAAMRQDTDKTKAVRRLTDENASLRQQLTELRIQSGTAPSRAQAVIFKREVEILDQLKNNDTAVGSTFAPGALFSMASQDSDGWAKEKTRIDADIFGELLRSPVAASLIAMENDEEDNIVAKVQVSWQPNMEMLHRVLMRNFNVRPPRSGHNGKSQMITVFFHENSQKDLRTDYTLRALKYLSGHIVVFGVTIGNKTVNLPVFGGGKGDIFRCPSGAIGASICILSKIPSDNLVQSYSGEISNPIRITLTRDQVEQVTGVSAKLYLVPLTSL